MRFQERLPERIVRAHCLACGPHFGPEKGIHALEASEREHGFLHRAQSVGKRTQLEAFKQFAGHDSGRDRRDGNSRRLRHERDGSGCSGVDFQQKHFAVLDRKLHVHKPQDVQCLRQHLGLVFDFADDCRFQRMRRDRACAVAGVDACKLNMLHDAGDIDVLSVGQSIDVDFDGFRKELVDQYGAVARNRYRRRHVLLKMGGIADDFHRPSSKHVGRPNHHGIADVVSDFKGLGGRGGRAVQRLLQPEFFQ